MNHALIALVESMFEVQQRHDLACQPTRPTGIEDAATGQDRNKIKHVNFSIFLPALTSPNHRYAKEASISWQGIRYTVSQHRQGVAKIDHLIQAVAEIATDQDTDLKNPENNLI